MSKRIALVCPKCDKSLLTEPEKDYYNNNNGCTINCDNCNLNLIGVDLSVCYKCLPAKRMRHSCGTKLTVLVRYL